MHKRKSTIGDAGRVYFDYNYLSDIFSENDMNHEKKRNRNGLRQMQTMLITRNLRQRQKQTKKHLSFIFSKILQKDIEWFVEMVSAFIDISALVRDLIRTNTCCLRHNKFTTPKEPTLYVYGGIIQPGGKSIVIYYLLENADGRYDIDKKKASELAEKGYRRSEKMGKHLSSRRESVKFRYANEIIGKYYHFEKSVIENKMRAKWTLRHFRSRYYLENDKKL